MHNKGNLNVRHRIAGIIVLLLSAITGNSLAAAEVMPPTEENPWYQVNIVIFKQPGHLLQSEQWKTGDEVKTHLPNNLIALQETPAASAENDTPAPQPSANGEILTLGESGAQATETVEIPMPFEIQTPTDDEFTKTLNRINRSSNYEVIYQKTWLQPPLEEKDALAILVQAGEVFDGLYELEGTARLHVSRYLHFSSNIWLSKYVQQIEVIKPWWQESSGIQANPEDSDANQFNLDFDQSVNFDDTTMNNSDLSLSSLQPMNTDISMGETITRYKSIRTAVMQESRRMRSGELHYLDHPLFGVIVKVVPYYPEAEQNTEAGDQLAARQ